VNRERALESLLREAFLYLKGKGVPNPQLDVALLVSHALGMERIQLYLNPSRVLTQKEIQGAWRLLERRGKREPVAYILGRKEFWSLEFEVDHGVLIPRPETELLVQCALEHIGKGALRGLDMGTGSGIIPVILTKERNRLKMMAVDSSMEALQLAKKNAKRHAVLGRIQFIRGSLFDALKRNHTEQLDLIVSNPPYIPTEEIQGLEPEIKDHEPPRALNGGGDGLRLLRKIIEAAPSYLAPSGLLCLEMGAGQAQCVRELIARTGGFREPQCFKDYGGVERVVLAERRS